MGTGVVCMRALCIYLVNILKFWTNLHVFFCDFFLRFRVYRNIRSNHFSVQNEILTFNIASITHSQLILVSCFILLRLFCCIIRIMLLLLIPLFADSCECVCVCVTPQHGLYWYNVGDLLLSWIFKNNTVTTTSTEHTLIFAWKRNCGVLYFYWQTFRKCHSSAWKAVSTETLCARTFNRITCIMVSRISVWL